jgi:hypothetical protein
VSKSGLGSSFGGVSKSGLGSSFRVLPRRESFASLHILTRRASEGSEALPSLARRVSMSFFGARVIIRCRFIFSGKNDELTPDFFQNDELTPDFSMPFRARMMN